jgi:hypothetical protein
MYMHTDNGRQADSRRGGVVPPCGRLRTAGTRPASQHREGPHLRRRGHRCRHRRRCHRGRQRRRARRPCRLPTQPSPLAAWSCRRHRRRRPKPWLALSQRSTPHTPRAGPQEARWCAGTSSLRAERLHRLQPGPTHMTCAHTDVPETSHVHIWLAPACSNASSLVRYAQSTTARSCASLLPQHEPQSQLTSSAGRHAQSHNVRASE